MLNEEDKKKLEQLRAILPKIAEESRKLVARISEGDIPIDSGPRNQKEWNAMLQEVENSEKDDK